MQRENGDESYKISVFQHLPNNGVKERKFRTVKILSDFGAAPIRGRATRVFEAYELDKEGNRTGESVAIKDTWMDADRLQEGDILHSMMKDVKESASDVTVDGAKYFLSVRTHGVVMIAGKQDSTLDLMMHGYTIPMDCNQFMLERTTSPSKPRVSKGGPSSVSVGDQTVRDYRQYSPKVHYRCVFNEVATPLLHVQNTSEMFLVLNDVVQGGWKFAIHVCTQCKRSSGFRSSTHEQHRMGTLKHQC